MVDEDYKISDIKYIMNSREYAEKILILREEETKKDWPEYDKELFIQAEKIVIGIFRQNSIYPSISVSDGQELIFFWKAGVNTIEISLQDGDFFIANRSENKEPEIIEGKYSAFPYGRMFHILSDYTQYVSNVNRDWKSLFTEVV